jgi:hypothetical protein
LSKIEEIKLCYRCQKKLSGPIYFYVNPLSVFDFIDEHELYCHSCKKIIEFLPENYGHFVEIKKQNNNLKILHLFDIAGVSTTLAHYQNKLGHQAEIYSHSSLDIFRYSELYDQTKLFNHFKVLLAYLLLKVKCFDIIHVHYYDNFVRYIKKLYPKKPVVLHYHGSDIRYQKEEEERKRNWQEADLVLVSTLDLQRLYPDFVYLPNPVDSDLFTRKNNFIPRTSLFLQNHCCSNQARELSHELAERKNLQLTIRTREEKTVNYVNMPSLLEQFEYYIDIRQEPHKKRFLDPLSLTALQSLKLGSKVLKTHSVYSSFPAEHEPIVVVKQLLKYYEELM